MTERRRMRGWHLALLLLGALLVIALAFWIWIDSVAARRWAEMRERVEELHSEALSRTRERPVLRGTSVPGRAFEDYDLAIAEANRIPDKIPLGEFISRTHLSDRAKVEAILAAHPILLDHLARGASRTLGEQEIEWEKSSLVVAGLLDAQWVANFAGSKVRLLAVEGKTGEAVDVILDGLQFGRDFGEGAPLIGRLISVAVSQIFLDELKTLVEAKTLGPEELTKLDRSLRILDENYPGYGSVFRNDVLHTGFAIQRPESLEEMEDFASGPGRFGLSSRLMRADAVLRLDGMAARLAGTEGASWREVERVFEEVSREAAESWNPLLRLFSYSLQTIEEFRMHRARLRLLRAAVAFRLEGRVPTLPDPFGANLLHSRSGGVLKIWSVSHDGGDDGGRGSWSRREDPDRVLELKE